MEFKLFEEEERTYREWKSKHDKMCPLADVDNQGAIGGRLTFSFTPTSLGVIYKVKCACGKEKDITSYDQW